MYELITSPSNQIIKDAKSLHKKRCRWDKRRFFIEGIRAVEESIISNVDIDYILYSDMLFGVKGGNELFDQIKLLQCRVYHISDKLFEEITDTESPQGIFASIKFNLCSLEKVLTDKENFFILLDRVQDPGNMGTIIRTADAFGSNGIIVTNGCVDVFNPKTIRSTMGSIFHVPLLYYNEINDAIYDLKNRGIQIMSTALKSSNYCHDVDFKTDFALVIGNEASGVSEDIINASDSLIKIPMRGKAESLNAAIASAVIMYEVLRQRQNI